MKENISELTRSFIFNQILFLISMHTVITLYIIMFNFNPTVEKVSIIVMNTVIDIKSYILLITLPIKASARKKYKNRNYLTPRDLFKPRSLPSAQFLPNPKKKEKKQGNVMPDN